MKKTGFRSHRSETLANSYIKPLRSNSIRSQQTSKGRFLLCVHWLSKKYCNYSCTKHCCNRFFRCLENCLGLEDPDESFLSLDYSSGDSEDESVMVNYMDPTKPYVPFHNLSDEDQQHFLFFMWEMLFKKLKGSVSLLQAVQNLHRNVYVKGT